MIHSTALIQCNSKHNTKWLILAFLYKSNNLNPYTKRKTHQYKFNATIKNHNSCVNVHIPPVAAPSSEAQVFLSGPCILTDPKITTCCCLIPQSPKYPPPWPLVSTTCWCRPLVWPWQCWCGQRMRQKVRTGCWPGPPPPWTTPSTMLTTWCT